MQHKSTQTKNISNCNALIVNANVSKINAKLIVLFINYSNSQYNDSSQSENSSNSDNE